MMGVDSHGKWGVPKQALKWEVAPDQPVCWETQILNFFFVNKIIKFSHNLIK